MNPRRLLTVLGPAFVAGLLASAAAPASASAPPTSAPPTEEAISAGLTTLLDELGPMTYDGDDITIGECPFTDAAATTTAFAAVADDVDLAAGDEAQIEMFVEYEMDREFEPAALSCDFESTTDDAGLEGVGILLADPAGEGVSDVLESLPTSLSPDDSDEPLAIGGELRGDCEEDECLFVWSGVDAVIAVSVEFGDDASIDLDAVTAATRELVTIVAGNVAQGT